jgi:hypothetical protein
MQWQYMSVMFTAGGFWLGGKLDGELFNAKLNELGEQGWELVSVFDTSMAEGRTRDIVAVFKRPAV